MRRLVKSIYRFFFLIHKEVRREAELARLQEGKAKKIAQKRSKAA